MLVRSFVLLALLTACDVTPSSSKLDGHFESGTSADIVNFKGKLRATAEYEPSRGVIISLPLIQEYQRNDLAAAILASGIDTLWITVPKASTELLTSSTFAALRQAAGANFGKVRLVRQQLGGDLSVWARDWAPLSASVSGGGMRLLDFNYYPERQADDFTAQSFERLLAFDRLSIPVYNEGGNFMNNKKGHCMMTTRVTYANAFQETNDDMLLSADQIKAYYADAAGCKQTTIFPRMPYEGTGHIDMWAKFLDDQTIIVSELRDELLKLYPRNQLDRVLRLQRYFNARADEIKKMGYKVVRIPIPGPVWSDFGDVFRSYTNSLLVNGSAIVPRYVTPAFPDLAAADGKYLDEAFRSKYEAEVKSIYESLGFKTSWIESDELISNAGAVHCTTMQIAR